MKQLLKPHTRTPAFEGRCEVHCPCYVLGKSQYLAWKKGNRLQDMHCQARTSLLSSVCGDGQVVFPQVYK